MFQCSDVYSDKVLNITTIDYAVKQLYMRPDANMIYDQGVFGGPLLNLFGNFKLTVDEFFDLKIINPITMQNVFGL